MASMDSRRVGDVSGAGGSFQPYLDSLRQELQQKDPTFVSVVVALLAVLLTLVFWRFVWSRKSSQRAVLFVGLCDAGKTLLFVRLLTGHYRDTQTSITDSSAVYKVNNNRGNSLTLIDLPGHESLRLQFLDRFKSSARAVVFVVDSAAFQREVKDVAEFLYQVLIDSMSLKNTPSFLIACNKQDSAMAKSAKLIQQRLEEELDRPRCHELRAREERPEPSTLTYSNTVPQKRKATVHSFTETGGGPCPWGSARDHQCGRSLPTTPDAATWTPTGYHEEEVPSLILLPLFFDGR